VNSAAASVRTRRAPAHKILDRTTGLLGLGLGVCVALAITGETGGSLKAPGGLTIFAGRISGLVGTYLMLVMVLLIARIPAVERAVGQDRLLLWHRQLGQWPIYLLVAHALLITIGYSQQARTGALHQLWILIDTYPDVLMAVVALALIVLAGVTSIRAARRRMRYETWWSIHLYMYLALALSFSHQIANGAAFVGHPLTRAVWAILWSATAGTVLVFRLLMPLGRSVWHGLRVVAVQEEGPGVVSIVCSGRRVDRLGIAGGQFFQWRFLTKGMWWQAHPYSLSAMPQGPYLRVTVKALGDHSAQLGRMKAGTRIAIEGPYGAFTKHSSWGRKVLLVGAGVGVTPVRALLEDFDANSDVVVVTRASSTEELLFQGEIRSLVSESGWQLHELVGSRREHPLDARHLRRMVPDIRSRDVYVCGPEQLADSVSSACRTLGVPEERLHHEQFAF
jgi:predicted ferric reductase